MHTGISHIYHALVIFFHTLVFNRVYSPCTGDFLLHTGISCGVYYIYHALVPAHVVSQFYHEMVISFHTLAHSIYMRCLKILYCTHWYFTQFLIILFFHTLHFISHNLATMY